MARIPETELERLKGEVSVERLVQASGIELKKSGKDWLGCCPFHADETASLVVTPAKNLWHCFGCSAAGGPIDWVMKRRGVSFRHAVELLREGVPGLAEGQQTQAIHARQRERRTLAGLLAKQAKHDIQTLHRHAQRLLKPLAVVNPYAEQLSFHARHARARRDHEKYLTLIDAIALLHQHQRPVRQAHARGQAIEYIEVTREDIEAAHALAHDVLGRSLDELPPVTRKLLRAVSGYVAERAHARGVPVEDVRFTRRELREACGWGDTQLRLHLERLAALELVASERSGRGGQVHYWLQVAGDGGQTRLSGLADPARLVAPEATTQKSRGVADEVAGPRAEVAGMSRGGEPTEKPASMRVGVEVAGDAARTDRAEAVNGRSYTYPQTATA